MITLLSALFIAGRENLTDAAVRQKYGMLCGAAGIFLNLLLFAGKLFAGTAANSVAIVADAVNNLSDAGSSLVTLIGFRLAGQAPDEEHPFGHGRIEYLSGLIVALLILLMGAELLKTSAEKILHPETVTGSALVLAILAASIGVKLYMFAYNRAVGQKIGSAALRAAALDSLGDTAATGAVLLSTLIALRTGAALDGWCGVLVALLILWSGVRAAKDTVSPLLGQAPEKDFVARVETIVLGHPEVRGMHDLIVHNYGPGRAVLSLHAEVSARSDLVAIHEVIDHIEGELRERLGCLAVIHIDPIVTDDPEAAALRAAVEEQARALGPDLQIHDFRLVACAGHTDVCFDLVLPYHFPMKSEEAARRLADFVAARPGGPYRAVIHPEHAFSPEEP